MIEIASLGMLVKLGQQLVGLGTSVEAKERAQIIKYMSGVADRLNAISSAIKGTSEQNLSQLCASLEGYGRVGAQHLSGVLTKANLAEVGTAVVKIAKDIREQSHSEWSPEARRVALRQLDEAIGEFSGMRSFLAEFSETRGPITPKFVGLMKRISYRSVIAVGATGIMTISAKAADLFGAGDAVTDAIDNMKDGVVEAAGEVESVEPPDPDIKDI